MNSALTFYLSLVLVLAASVAKGADSNEVALVELQLPAFQQTTLATDEPIRDMLLDSDGTAFLLGRTSIWRWAAPTKGLKRLRLGNDKVDDNLMRLGTDGLSLFAAGESVLYQAQWAPGRVFRYAMSPKAPTFGFAGVGDDFWILHGRSLFQFDRYGRTLQPQATNVDLLPGDLPLFDTKQKTTWIARKKSLLRSASGKTAVTFNASHTLRGIAKSGNDLILHTSHAVLRIGANGKLLSSIPVEGQRQLLAMDVTPKAHAYLFDDDLLEVYNVTSKTVARYHVPLGGATEVKGLALRETFVGVLADGRPLIFRIASSH